MNAQTHDKPVAPPLPLFEDPSPGGEPAWLREVYVALPLEQARALERWARAGGLRRAQVVCALVRALLAADWAPPRSPEALEVRLKRALRRAAGEIA